MQGCCSDQLYFIKLIYFAAFNIITSFLFDLWTMAFCLCRLPYLSWSWLFWCSDEGDGIAVFLPPLSSCPSGHEPAAQAWGSLCVWPSALVLPNQIVITISSNPPWRLPVYPYNCTFGEVDKQSFQFGVTLLVVFFPKIVPEGLKDGNVPIQK